VDQIRDFVNHFPLQHLQFFQIEAPSERQQNYLIGPHEFALAWSALGSSRCCWLPLKTARKSGHAGKQRLLSVLVAALILIIGALALLAMIFRE